jgi:hypothetical protein
MIIPCDDCHAFKESQGFVNLRAAAQDLVLYMRKTVPGMIEIRGTDVAAAGLAERLTRLEAAAGLMEKEG